MLAGSAKLCHDRMQPRLVGGAARREGRSRADRRVDRQRPADDISGDDPLARSASGDLLAQQARQVERALAVPGKDDRPVAGTSATKRVERARDVANRRGRAPASHPCCRAGTRRTPPGGSAAPRCRRRSLNALAWLRTNRRGAIAAVAPVVERGVPAVALEIGRRVDEEDRRRGLRGLRCRRRLRAPSATDRRSARAARSSWPCRHNRARSAWAAAGNGPAAWRGGSAPGRRTGRSRTPRRRRSASGRRSG